MSTLPTAEQARALLDFAARNGRSWRMKLNDAWATGRDAEWPDGALLRQVRNNLGPSWLMRVTVAKLESCKEAR